MAESQLRRLWLDVPTDQGADAQMKGAIWDPTRNRWYITEDIADERYEDFEQWHVPEPYTHMIFTGIYGMQGKFLCPHCQSSTSVVCIFSTDAEMIHEGLEPFAEDVTRFSYVFTFVQGASPEVEAALARQFPKFYKDRAKPTHQVTPYMNHCEHCDGKISDKLVHNRGAVFSPEDWGTADLQLYRLDVPLPVKINGGAGAYWSSDAGNNNDLFGRFIQNAK